MVTRQTSCGCFMLLPDGAYIDVKALKRYGRFDVTFYKTQDESYVMDFSRPNP